MPLEELSPSNQIRGNIGLYYVCFQLSLRGWNVMPTARNAQGPDVLIYSEDAAKTKTIQVKMVTGNGNVRLGRSNHVFGDFLVICRLDNRKIPECFVLKPKEVRLLARRSKEESTSFFWLDPREYKTKQFRERWMRIGSGLLAPIRPVPPPNEPVDL